MTPALRLRGAFALVVLSIAAFGVPPSAADPIDLAVDVPTTLAGTTFAPHQIVRFESGLYSVALDLPEETRILALDRASDGRWLFVPAAPVTLGGVEYTARDIVATDGLTFARILDGAGSGIPEYARIDAILPEPAGAWVLSFDVPVALAGQEYGASDLVRYDGAFSSVWDAAAAGVPAYANVVGVGRLGPGFAVSFDVPTRIGGTEILPGRIVQTSSEALALVELDPAWPLGSQLRDFAVVTPAAARPAGAVPDGVHVAGIPLTVAKTAGATLTLQWGASCGEGAVDYEVYQGAFGAWDNAAPAACSTSTALAWTSPMPPGNAFFLVVPRSDSAEGSYGRRKDGSKRPPSPSACLPQESSTCEAP